VAERETGLELPKSLPRARRLARAALWWEGAWPALWPVLAVLGLFAIFAFLGLPAHLPAWLHIALLIGFAAALAWAATGAIARLRRAPAAEEADRRIEAASGLAHRPLAALQDRPAIADPAALALWAAHRKRMRARLERGLSVGAPRPGMAARDPRALRLGLVVGFAAALGVAGWDTPALLARAVTPGFSVPLAPPALRVEAWVTPPAYTGAPPIFLEGTGGQATVPAGSRMQIALSGGGPASPELVGGGDGAAFESLGAGAYAASLPLAEARRVAIRRDGQEVVAWSLAVQADAPPTAGFTEPPGRVQRGLAVRIPWRAEDDWGVAALRAEFRLAARPNAAPLVQEMALPSGPSTRSVRGQALPDLSAHPWAGLPVVLRLVARDGAEQEGASDEVRLALPERSFNHPVARALIEVRKQLSLAPEERLPAARALDAIAASPEAFENDPATILALRTARGQLQRDRRPEAIGEVQEILWEAALALEEGRDERTARALAEAQRALREALAEQERQNRENPAGAEPNREQQAETQRRIEQLREAIRRHLEALAERLQRENAEALPYDPQQRMLDQREMERRTRRMEEANRQNRPEDAQRELAELEEMLRALQEGRVARGESPERQQQRQRGQQQMGVVQDMVRRQADLLDQSQRRAEAEEQRQQQQRRAQQPWGQRPGQPQPQPPQGSAQQQQQAQAEQQAEARRQRALRRALGELMQQFGDLAGEVPEALGQADQAMREAQEALGQGRDSRPAQQEAIRRLQEGGRQMAQSMQRQFGQSQAGEGEPGDDFAEGDESGGEGMDEGTEMGEGRDPLGRRSRETAGNAENGSDTRVPEEAEMLRTRRIQEELRRRGAERGRPAEELDYIDRLLRRF